MRAALLIAALVLPNIALALPDDATLSRLLVGTWHGHRHVTEYRADGTWIMDPPDEGDNSRGKLRIEHGRLSPPMLSFPESSRTDCETTHRLRSWRESGLSRHSWRLSLTRRMHF
jgi:hypothetical protein